MKTLVRIATAFAPLAATPLLVHGIAHGSIGLGGGEKDLVWALVWLAGSVVYAGASLVSWRRGSALFRSVVTSLAVAIAALAAAAIALALFGELGVAGRF